MSDRALMPPFKLGGHTVTCSCDLAAKPVRAMFTCSACGKNAGITIEGSLEAAETDEQFTAWLLHESTGVFLDFQRSKCVNVVPAGQLPS